MTTLEKIRAEVEHISVWEQVSANSAIIRGGDEVKAIVLKILDKYASEECDRDCEHCAYIECPIEPCEDAVSRQAVLDLFKTFWRCFVDDENKEIFKRQILELPSVQPKEKTGHWIAVYQGDEIINYRCSECELGDTNGSTNLYGWNYCRRCGARMKTECDHPDKCHECEKILTCDYYKRGAE